MRIIDVVSERDGTPTKVIEHGSTISTGSLDQRSTIPGLVSYRLADGRRVNRVDGGFVDLDGSRYNTAGGVQ